MLATPIQQLCRSSFAAAVCAAALALTLGAQEPPPTPAAPAAAAQPAQTVQPATARSSESGGITEDELKQMLVGKPLYLRGGYLDDSLSFDDRGALTGHSPTGSYTLNVVQIEKVHLTKRKVELEGIRYGLHFLGALPYEDPANAMDRVRITPKKKALRISIEREAVVKPKKEKEAKKGAKGKMPAPAAVVQTAAPTPQPGIPANTTTSPAHAAQMLRQALDRIFAPGLDPRMIAAMPEFWQLYYKAAAAKTDFRPTDPAVLRQSAVDRKARLLTAVDPQSNQYAQDAGVAGMALYHVVVGADGKPQQIAVARPIGFGLDENAVAAIAKARFEPAVKAGKPVPVLLDLVVEFRIYSKLTAAPAPQQPAAQKPSAPILPGPYSVEHN